MSELKRFYICDAKLERIYDKDAGLCDAHEADALIAKLREDLSLARELILYSRPHICDLAETNDEVKALLKRIDEFFTASV